MASLEGILLMVMVDAHEKRDIMTTNVPNTFIQIDMIYMRNDEHIIMKITGVLVDILVKGVLVDILVKKNPQRYSSYMVYEKGKSYIFTLAQGNLQNAPSGSFMVQEVPQ